MPNKKIAAIDLMIEDLNVIHNDIRTRAKQLECEFELDEYKKILISNLNDLRKTLQ